MEQAPRMKDKIRALLHSNIERLRLRKGDSAKRRQVIVISGSPRSGTTWLAEILDSLDDHFLIFEPLHPSWFPESKEAGFGPRAHLSMDAEWKEGKEYLEKALSGRVMSTHSTFGLVPRDILKRLLHTNLIVKFVRLNRLLPWALKNLEIDRLFVIIRHPCSVITSQIATGFTGYTRPDGSDYMPLKKDVMREVNDIDIVPERHVKRIKRIEHDDEVLIAAWYLDHLVPLKLLGPDTYHLVVYEELFQDSKRIEDIFRYIDRPMPKDIMNIMKRPSKTITEGSKRTIASVDHLSKWKKVLGPERTKRALSLLKDLDILFYDDGPTLDRKELRAWIAK